jgi:hypothetical protein
MGIAQRQGGQGPRFSEDLVNVAMIFAAALLVLFFLLVIRMYFDQGDGKGVFLKPVRSPANVLKMMFKQDPERDRAEKYRSL